jgi:hypothetical protein
MKAFGAKGAAAACAAGKWKEYSSNPAAPLLSRSRRESLE